MACANNLMPLGFLDKTRTANPLHPASFLQDTAPAFEFILSWRRSNAQWPFQGMAGNRALTTVPEAEAYALMLAGPRLAGFAARRRLDAVAAMPLLKNLQQSPQPLGFSGHKKAGDPSPALKNRKLPFIQNFIAMPADTRSMSYSFLSKRSHSARKLRLSSNA